MVFPSNKIVFGTTKDDILYPKASDKFFTGHNTFYGDDGNDIIFGNVGNGILYGGKGNDELDASALGDDILNGVEPLDIKPGIGEIDKLIGGLGQETFVLGDAKNYYYNYSGNEDYALITQFRRGLFSIEKDTIQLHGKKSDYSLEQSPSGTPNGTAIYLNREVDIFFLQDTSESFKDELPVSRLVAADLINRVRSIKPDTRQESSQAVTTRLQKYNSSGNLIWDKQLRPNEVNSLASVTINRFGNTYATGSNLIQDAEEQLISNWVAKYDTNGNQIWTQQFGAFRTQFASDIAVDGVGNVYITGSKQGDGTENSKVDLDAFVAKYDTYGNLIWTQQIDSNSEDGSSSVAVDSVGNVYITGATIGNLEGNNVGSYDAYVAKFNSNGTPIWKRQWGTSLTDLSVEVAVDDFGNVYITGETDGNLQGTNSGGTDAYLVKYDTNGNLISIDQFGSTNDDFVKDISIDAAGNVYLTGDTKGDFYGTNSSKRDVWVAKYLIPNNVPQTTSIVGTPSNDTLTGNSDNNIIDAREGDDI